MNVVLFVLAPKHGMPHGHIGKPSPVIQGSSLSMKGMSLYLLSFVAHCFTAWSRISRERRWAKSSTAVFAEDDIPEFAWMREAFSMLHPLSYLPTSLLPSSRIVCGKGLLDFIHPMVRLLFNLAARSALMYCPLEGYRMSLSCKRRWEYALLPISAGKKITLQGLECYFLNLFSCLSRIKALFIKNFWHKGNFGSFLFLLRP